MSICLFLCHFDLSLLAIKLNYVAYYPVILSFPFHFGAYHLEPEWCFTELFVFSVVIWHLIICQLIL